MKFKFPYDNLMKSKKINRDVAYRDLSEARNEADAVEGQLNRFHSDVRSSRGLNEEIAGSGEITGSQIETLKWTEQFLQGQKIKIERQRDLLKAKNEVVEAKLEVLSEAAKEFRIFEKLKEKMHLKHKKLEKKRDLKTVDEIVVMRSAEAIQKRQR